jgi:hypothetical protein
MNIIIHEFCCGQSRSQNSDPSPVSNFWRRFTELSTLFAHMQAEINAIIAAINDSMMGATV